MPTRGEIQEDIVRRKSTSQDDVRRKYVSYLSAYTGRDTIVYASAFTLKAPAVPPIALSLTLDDLQGFMASLHGLKGDALDLILHSPGGSMEAADQLVQPESCNAFVGPQ
jgi:ClpP class serine protease